MTLDLPPRIGNCIDGRTVEPLGGEWFPKINPATGERLADVARSRAADVGRAVSSAAAAQPAWADTTPVARGELLRAVAHAMQLRREEIARVVALETGKSTKDALGETSGAIALAGFYAGEGQRLYGRTTTSGVEGRQAMTIREPIGVAGLIAAANTPIANVAWKLFPALVCGNAAVLKAAEDAPATAWLAHEIARDAGLPPGLFNVVQGLGEEAGAPLVAHPDVPVVSFTGSTSVGREIAGIAGRRLAKISLELGGKNPLVVCDDADLDLAAKWVLLSAFSNAGQRCASGTRIIVFDAVYEPFRALLLERTAALRVGTGDGDDFGPVINLRQLDRMLKALEAARARGARILAGGARLTGPAHQAGFYLAPTLVEGTDAGDDLSTTELFGPIACLYRAKGFDEALALANDSPYGLTACIHTRSVHRAMTFARKVAAGVAVVNAGTFGSEPHMPFGGVKQSGNGSREPGTEALDIYSNVKDVYISTDPART
ncbi:MAG: aldehyde dehydrogenase [Acidobacteria bacterium]|nr:aldehyde dehydrogenase [Acidobacteriota bacterium]